MDAEEEMDETERADKALISMLGGLLTWDNLKVSTESGWRV